MKRILAASKDSGERKGARAASPVSESDASKRQKSACVLLLASAPAWARYIDSRLKQFVSR